MQTERQQYDPEAEIHGKTAREWVTYVQEKASDQREARQQLEKAWFQNLCMYMNMHYVSWDTDRNTMIEPRVPSYRVRAVMPYTFASCEIQTAKITKNAARMKVRAANSSNEAIAKAKLAEHDLEYRYYTLKMPNADSDAMKWAVVCGTAFIKHYWDPRAGDMWEEPTPVQPAFGDLDDEDGATDSPMLADANDQMVWVGDQDLRVCPPFEIECDETNGPNMDKVGWLKHRMLMDVERVQFDHPEHADVIKSTDQYDRDSLVDTRYLGLVSQSTMRGATDLKGKVLVSELWERPWSLKPKERMQWPRGRVIKIAGDVLIHIDHNPNEDIQIPFVKYDHVLPPGRFWGMGIPDIMGNMNKHFDQGFSKWLENLRLHCQPKWMNPRSSGLIDSAIDSEPSEVIDYNLGSKPEQVQPPQLVGSGFFEGMRMNLDAMKDATGTQDVSRGSAPASASGAALSILEENDADRLGPILKRRNISLRESATMILKLDKQFCTEPRLLKIRGPGGWTDVEEFIGTDLEHSTDVEVEENSTLPTSKATQRALTMEMWANGMLSRDDPDIAVKLMDMGVADAIMKEKFADAELADEENRRMKKGSPQKVMSWYEHAVHIARHNLERKQGDFLSLDPMIQQMFDQHVKEHEAAAIQKQVEDAQKQQQLQAQIAPPPAAGQPPQAQGQGAAPAPPQMQAPG